ncbi:MAG: TonB-dependent receptor [Bacteroidales bacterium]|nr:TonB-dependent receptor [Bacteroidales bacterium]
MKKVIYYIIIGIILTLSGNTVIKAQDENGSAADLLELSFEDLMNMDVTTVSKSAEKQSDAPGIISVLTKDEIKRFGGTTLKDILERIPGLIGSTVYMTDRSIISARGDQIQASSSHVLLLINGRPIREALEGGIKSEIYETFPVNIIESIEVIKGPGSVLYGSDAFSAVINVITKKVDTSGVSVEGQVGGEGAYGVSGSATINAKDLNILVGARHFNKADWDIDYKYYDEINGDVDTFSYTIPNKGSGAFVDANYKNLKLMFSYNQWETFYSVTDFASILPFPTYGTSFWKKYFGDIGYDFKISKIWDMSLHGTYTKSLFENSTWPFSNRDSYEAMGEWTNYINPTDKLRIIFGGLYNYVEGLEKSVSPTSIDTLTDASRYSLGFYTQLDYRIIKQLKLIGGIQVNKVKDIDVNFVPRLGAIWNPMDAVSVKALYSEAFRAPSINELNIDFPSIQGNSDLKPENVKTFDLGVNYQKNQIHLGVNYFNSVFTNIIIQNRTLVPGVGIYDNIGEVKMQGVEFEGKYFINKKIYANGSLTYFTSKDSSDNKNVTPIANLAIKAGISYSSDGVTLSLFDNYQGSLDEKYETQFNESPGAYNSLNLFAKIDLNQVLKLKLGKELALTVQANNLLNKEVWLPNWGLAPGTSIPFNRGRTIYFGLNFSL